MRPEDFGPGRFAAGEKHALDLEFTGGGESLSLPVLLARGARPGRTLVATAGVHGDEYEGVRAILDIFAELRPEEMSGDFLAVPACNPPAFWNLSRTSPLDDCNLARVFPGNPAGSPTETIAYWLDQCIIRHADLYLDLHSAGVKCLMPSMIGYHAPDQRAREAAIIFGAKVVWAHPNIAPGRTLSAAIDRGIPALYTEARGAGRIHADDLSMFRQGIRNLLRHLQIVSGRPEPAPCEIHLCGDGNTDQSVSSSLRGFLIPRVELLERVEKGQGLGVLVNLHGAAIERYEAPATGVVALIHACPMVMPGEPLFLVTGVLA